MTSKKAAASKRAPLPRAADHAKAFLKDWERLTRAGRHNMRLLKEAMLLLIANDAPLGAEWLDHALSRWREANPAAINSQAIHRAPLNPGAD